MGLDANRHSAEVQAVEMAEAIAESQGRRVRESILQANFHKAAAQRPAIQLRRGFFHEMAWAVLAVHCALRLPRPKCYLSVLRDGFRTAGLFPRRCMEPLGAPPQ